LTFDANTRWTLHIHGLVRLSVAVVVLTVANFVSGQVGVAHIGVALYANILALIANTFIEIRSL